MKHGNTRNWKVSLSLAGFVAALTLLVSVIVIAVSDRITHWGWMASTTAIQLAVLTLIFRRRWI